MAITIKPDAETLDILQRIAAALETLVVLNSGSKPIGEREKPPVPLALQKFLGEEPE